MTRHYQLEDELQKAKRHLKEQSMTDHLTGLGNRRYLYDALSNLLLNSREQTPLSLCLIDLDDFKSINDNYGHHKGDKILKAFAKFALDQLRESDITTRFGGEEFVVIMPETSIETAHNVIFQILEKLNQQSLEGLKITFSAGISLFQGKVSADELIDMADKDMFRVKSAGKNQVSVYNLNHAH